MNILISNDDGVHSPGLAILAGALSALGKVQVIAPDRNRSGASNSLTLDRPLELHQHDNGFIGVNGTPTDSVHLGVSGILGIKPDIVVSGINAGPNLGDDVLYSGTVAAAFEGRHLSYPALAVSSSSFQPKHYSAAAELIVDIVKKISESKVEKGTVLNINIPDCPFEQIEGIHVTRLGHRTVADKPVAVNDPRGKLRYWIAGAGLADDCEVGTDFFALEKGYVSVTPLQFDMTRYSAMDKVADWLESCL